MKMLALLLLVAAAKPRAPVDVSSSLEGTAPADRALEVKIEVAPRRKCSQLATRIRALDGVELVEGGHWHQYPACTKVAETVRVRVPAGVAGYLVADVEFRVGSRQWRESRMFPLATAGARPKLQSAGTPAQDADGQRVIELK
jgi:hypothetical protein